MARAEDVEIYSGSPGVEYKTIRRVNAKSEFKVRKGLPTAEDASERLRALAAKLGANAVVDATLTRSSASGSYGGISASGLAVVLPDDVTCPSCAETIKRKARKCRFCGEEMPHSTKPLQVQEPTGSLQTSDQRKSRPQGRWPTWKIVAVATIGALVLLFVIAGIAAERERRADPVGYARREAARRAEDQKRERDEQRELAAKKQAELDKSAAAAAEAERERQSGFHCLSGWDGSNRSTVEQVKARLRDPSSFQHDETRIAPNKGGSHALVMTYRAKNGFGGMNVERAVASVDDTTCQATLLSIG